VCGNISSVPNTMFDEERLKKSIINSGVIEKRDLSKYLRRFLLGKCKIIKNGECWIFSLPEEKVKFYRFLKRVTPGTIIDLSPVARCLIIDEENMYTLINTY
jgi:hypothetical protein